MVLARTAHIFIYNTSVVMMVITSCFSGLSCLRHGAMVIADCAAIHRPPAAVHGHQHGYETVQAAVTNADSSSRNNIAPSPLL